MCGVTQFFGQAAMISSTLAKVAINDSVFLSTGS
jgi:hypothetical protein